MLRRPALPEYTTSGDYRSSAAVGSAKGPSSRLTVVLPPHEVFSIEFDYSIQYPEYPDDPKIPVAAGRRSIFLLFCFDGCSNRDSLCGGHIATIAPRLLYLIFSISIIGIPNAFAMILDSTPAASIRLIVSTLPSALPSASPLARLSSSAVAMTL